MAAKRFFDDSDDKDQDPPNDKRIRPNRPSFASVIGEVVMVKNLQNLFSGLEPLLRRVVNEEVERAIRHSYPAAGSMMMTRSPSLRIEAAAAAAAEQAPKYALVFRKKLCLPIFTGSRVLDTDGTPIQVMLVDVEEGNRSSEMGVPTSLPQPVKLELVVLDGDFPPNERSWWTSEEFNRYIVKERTGKRPLLAGELTLTLRDGHAPLTGDIDFTDNSSWIRSRKFRLAARVVVAAPNQPPLRIREAISEPFVVKDHRGELYKKHHPPMLEDEVWRLEKIGKDGAFHKKLSAEGINSVQEFLKLSVVDPQRLRKILGVGMSEKMWDVTIKHAKTCNMGNKLYVYRGPNYTIYLNPICQLVRADISGQTFPGRDLNNINRSYIERLVREAYGRWSNLEEIDGVLNDNTNNVAFLAQGETSEQFENSYEQSNYFGDKSTEVAAANYVQNHNNNNNNAQIECSEWPVNAAAFATSSFGNGIPYSFPGSQSDGDITPPGSASVIDGGVSRWNFT